MLSQLENVPGPMFHPQRTLHGNNGTAVTLTMAISIFRRCKDTVSSFFLALSTFERILVTNGHKYTTQLEVPKIIELKTI